jgi:hypothetical protein
MSKMSGDTARYNRVRIQRIKMRASVRALREEIEARKALSIPSPVGEKPKP